MKPQRRAEDAIERLPDLPIEIKAFDASTKEQSSAYLRALNQLLAPFDARVELFGSVELEIAGKGEWEFAIYLSDAQWFPVLTYLINHYHGIHTLMDDFAVFTDVSQGTPVEVIPMRNEAALRNQAIMNYWRGNPAALKAYEQGKLEHAFSKREYYRWKDEYIASLVEGF